MPLKNAWIILLFFPLFLNGQPTPKKALSTDDYSLWKTISGRKISANGNLVVFEVKPLKGDGELHIFDSRSGRTRKISRGTRAEIASGEDFILFRIAPPFDSVREAKIKKVKKEAIPVDSLGVLMVSSGKMVKFPRLKSVAISEENSGWIAFTTPHPEVPKDTSRNARPEKPPKKEGDLLVLLNSESGDTLQFTNVTEFICPKKGGFIYFLRQWKDSLDTRSSVHRHDANSGEVTEIFSSDGFIKKLVADEPGEQVAFLFSRDTTATRVYSLYYGKPEENKFSVAASAETSGMPAGWFPSENGMLRFSKEGEKLWLATAPSPQPKAKDTIPEDEKPGVDIWSWQDFDLMSQQLNDAEREKKRSYQAVWLTREDKFVQLADTFLREIVPAGRGNGDLAIGVFDQPYRRSRIWDWEGVADYYLVDVMTGERSLLADRIPRARLSPTGRYLFWFEKSDSSYHILPTRESNGLSRSLTKAFPFPLYNEQHDTPGSPPPYGIAGWSRDDNYLFIYDRYDIWKTDPEGKEPPVCITNGYGRKNLITFRYFPTDPEEEFIPEEGSALLSGFDTRSMASGFFRTTLFEIQNPRQLVMTPHHYGFPMKAKNSGKLLWSRESATEFPNLWVSDDSFSGQLKISDANPQQKNYNWLNAELIEWTSFSGEKLKGILYKPEDFNPAHSYPMVVYFYERSSEGLHRHSIPSPSRSTINKSFYASNRYLVFVPDITYQTGFPGQSAYDAIVSGVYALAANNSWVDLTRVGLQGQSWGGYQTAWLITRTNLFAAAMAGAPVSNMTSAYGGIRWESGMSRMAQYEQTQSRIGATLWEKPFHYIENSPLFTAPSISTPLLIMHNDKDGAVPWTQGIELFLALTRLQKPVWMLTYNGEPHNLKEGSWANRMDLDIRMFQFFNHYLKGEEMPPWMEKGIPAIRKGEETGY